MPDTIPPDPRFDPTALARFGRLELLARLVVEGLMAGRHRSPFRGLSAEFAGHRRYGPGDEIRHIDWRAFGKSDRYFVKESEEETNLRAYLVVDASGSMGYVGPSSPHSKLEHARQLAASFAYLMIGQRDAVGLVATGLRPLEPIPPRSAPGHFSSLCRCLEAAEAGGEAPLAGVLRAMAGRARRRGLVVVLSDGFEPIDGLATALRQLRHRHHEVLFFQILAPEEESFPFRHPARFLDLERPGPPIRVDPASMRGAYLERFDAFRRDLEGRIRGMGADYQKVSTATPHDRTLLDYLASRSGRGRPRPGGGP